MGIVAISALLGSMVRATIIPTGTMDALCRNGATGIVIRGPALFMADLIGATRTTAGLS